MASDNVRITKRIVDETKPTTKDVFVRDAELRGFALKVSAAGVKSYVVEYRLPGGRGSEKGRYTIGKHGSPWTPESARKEALIVLEGVRRGINPMTAKQDKHRETVNLAFAGYVDLFIEKYGKRSMVRSWPMARAALRYHVLPKWQNRPITQITRSEVSSLTMRIADDKPAIARYIHALLRKMFRWAVSRGDIALSPMADMEPPAVVPSRDRVLTDTELRAVWHASLSITPFYGPAVRLLIATGQRRDEVIGMNFDELDMQARQWLIPAARCKNGVATIVPLNDFAIVELVSLGALDRKRGLVFTTTGTTCISGLSKCKRRLDGLVLANLHQNDPEATLIPWRIHDLRRTVATGLQKLGVKLEVTEAVLNHLSGSRSGIVGVYQRYDFKDEKRAALEAWGRHLAALLNGKNA